MRDKRTLVCVNVVAGLMSKYISESHGIGDWWGILAVQCLSCTCRGVTGRGLELLGRDRNAVVTETLAKDVHREITTQRSV